MNTAIYNINRRNKKIGKLNQEIDRLREEIEILLVDIDEWELVDFGNDRSESNEGVVVATFKRMDDGMKYAVDELGLGQGNMSDPYSYHQNFWKLPTKASDSRSHTLRPAGKYKQP